MYRTGMVPASTTRSISTNDTTTGRSSITTTTTTTHLQTYQHGQGSTIQVDDEAQRKRQQRKRQQQQDSSLTLTLASSSLQEEADKEHEKSNATSTTTTSIIMTIFIVTMYVLSGCIQPIMMTLLRQEGLADPSCQLYMMFYYFGPACSIFIILCSSSTLTSSYNNNDGNNGIYNKKGCQQHDSNMVIATTNTMNTATTSTRPPRNNDHVRNHNDDMTWPSTLTIMKTCAIALFDIASQSMNYTGASLAGPTIFAIVYSSVTIWAALYSQLFLSRLMDTSQWIAVITVFGGLAVTATDSLELGPGVLHGLILVTVGSSMHGLFYVMSEAVMTRGQERMSVLQNCSVQGITASISFLTWQMIYTVPRLETKIIGPMQDAGTSLRNGFGSLLLFATVSFIHSISFYYTLRHLPGGSTSAGVFKGLQAVLVFVLTDWIYCGHVGGSEMCFSKTKFISLLTVAGGVIGYGLATTRRRRQQQQQRCEHFDSSTVARTDGYQPIPKI